ncbi:hypothetical protein [Streptomyces boncukensis]|uniref:GNAT family N-acetyltransferase n=1 Tax=Streptomyces boncukensis TaxID=2711219 RepID=A0A6G4X330_9ACTN|nr:hypothetical protein [Streptomyces boncukensis]NGO71071.1 hypothetical protein [Streptomyces boncukensis]
MGRQLVPLTLDNLPDLPKRCRACVFWELDPVSGDAATQAGRPDLEKESWISSVLLEWGSCGRVVYVDEVPVGFVLYAPPAYVPRSFAFPTSPGFKTVRPHHRYPRLRLELRSTVSWREDVERALDQLLGAVQKDPVLRPL